MVDFAKELKKGATTASEKLTKTVEDITSKAGGATGANLDALKQAVISAGSSFGVNVGQIPGLDVLSGSNFNSIAQSTKDLNIATGLESGQTKTSPPPDFKPPLPNQLSQYASVNCLFTLSILSDEAINFPDLTYRRGQLGSILLKSANNAPPESMIKTAFGTYNFYMDDLKLTTIMGLNKSTGVTNATNITFKVIEPFSMGLFFQAIQLGARQAGYQNYLNVPVLLTIEWKGWTDLNKEQNIVVRQIPMKLRELGMKVTGKGCEYEIEAYPYNEQGSSKTYNEIKTDIGIECDKGTYTIQNLLQTGANSLQAVLNRRLQESKKSGAVDVPDEILILFPSDTASDPSSTSPYSNELNEKSATTSTGSGNAAAFYGKLGVSQGANSTKVQGVDTAAVNLIGQAKLGFNEKNKGETPFAKDADSYDKEKGIVKVGSVVVDLNNSKFHFSQGALITDVITNVILSSDWARNALNPAQIKDGMVAWFKIETQVYNIPQEDKKVGNKPKCVVYRVVPYKVSASRFMPPDSKTPGEDKLKKQSLKEYNYIYTGKNTDILDFAIDFKAGFYTALFADKNKKSEAKTLNAKTGQAADTKEEEQNNSMNSSSSYWGERNSAQASNKAASNPTQVRYDAIESETAKLGGASPADDEATAVARQFHDAITNQVDMINLNLTILGDPYYISDSGMGNYSAKEVQGYDNITGDGSINYQNGEVVITIKFRTPIDIDLEKGSWDFRDTQPVAQFSGLFQVISVDSSISKNKFTQVLSCIRLPGQDPKLDEKPSGNIVVNEPTATTISNSTNNINTNPTPPGLVGVINTGGVIG